MCGGCCRDIIIKNGDKWLKRPKDFDTLCENEPKHDRFEITGKDDFGHLVFRCTMRGEDGLCSCYEDRLSLCRSYPAKTIYYQGGWIGADCGFRYKSVKFRDVFFRKKSLRIPSFSKVLEQEIKQVDK